MQTKRRVGGRGEKRDDDDDGLMAHESWLGLRETGATWTCVVVGHAYNHLPALPPNVEESRRSSACKNRFSL
jgi:hypothetical protein